MAAIGNGLALHGGLRPFVATFFVFSDYTKPMARLTSLMKLPLIYVFTHDSIGVGEDGPTHEPIEQLAAFRSMPNFTVFRPCDRTETALAWEYAIESKDEPTALVLTRQNLPQMAGSSKEALKGAYILENSDKETPDGIIIASGSEVNLAVSAKAELKNAGIDVRVVSMPSMDVFEKQSEEYKESVLPKSVRKRVAVEALSDFGWYRYVGLDGKVICMKGFGASGPANQLFEHFGFTVENVVNTVKNNKKINIKNQGFRLLNITGIPDFLCCQVQNVPYITECAKTIRYKCDVYYRICHILQNMPKLLYDARMLY